MRSPRNELGKKTKGRGGRCPVVGGTLDWRTRHVAIADKKKRRQGSKPQGERNEATKETRVAKKQKEARRRAEIPLKVKRIMRGKMSINSSAASEGDQENKKSKTDARKNTEKSKVGRIRVKGGWSSE